MSVREIWHRSPGTGGLRLFWRVWRPESGRPGGRVLIAHGYGEHGGRYRHVADRLTASGLCVVVPDHRGHGRSDGRPVTVERFDDYVDDLRMVAQAAAREHGEQPTVLLGHSMGGLIACLYAVRYQEELRGLVLSAPAVVAGRVSPIAVSLGQMLSRVAPETGVKPIPWQRVSRDPAVVAAYRADPWVHRRRIPARLGAEWLRAMAVAEAGMPTLTLPILAMQGTADALVDPSAAAFVHSRVGSADRTLLRYPGLYHEVLNEPERDRVLDDLVGWLLPRLAPRPSPVGQRRPG
jgi:alpha-beta hydrolase superfamily lysophospholipase